MEVAMDPLDVAAIKKDFPILEREVHGGRLVYLDSANTSQKPRAVLDAMAQYYEQSNANVHRGTYLIAEEATAALEGARAKVARFIGASASREVVFTKNATEALNLVAKAWGRANLTAGDAVVLTELEHHANIVPWHQLHDELGIELRWIPITPDGHLDLTDLDRLVDGAKLVTFAAMSNVLGTLLPVERLVTAAHAAGAIAVVDASQYVPHVATDVQAWGADFAAFTGHKMCGPTGIGVLWGTSEILEATPPFLTGGEMILNVTKEGFTPNELPWKFEAGTPPIAEAVGLGAAVDYLSGLGMDAVREHEVSLTAYALRTLEERFGDDLTVHGPSEPAERGGVMSFSYQDIHPHDLTQVFDEHGVCVRAGHHCAKPLMRELGVAATARASLYVYNDEADVDALADAIDAAAASLPPGRIATSHAWPRRPVPRDHPRPLPLAAEPGRAAHPAGHAGRGLQPAVRRRDRRLRRRRGRHRRRHPHRRAGLLDQPVVGVDDVRGREGQDARRGAGAHPCLQGDDVDPRAVPRRRGRRAPAEADPEVKLGDLEALRGVVKFPVRIKCATLSWNTLAPGARRAGRLLSVPTDEHGRVDPAFGADERTMLSALPRLPPRHARVEGLAGSPRRSWTRPIADAPR